MATIYLDVDGVLLRRSQGSRSGFDLSPHAQEFLARLVDCHQVRWLTTRCRAGMPNDVHRAFRLAMQVASLPPRLAELISLVEPVEWNACKTEGIALTDDFYWIDDNPTPQALQVLAERGCLDRWIKPLVDQDHNDLLRVSRTLEERISAAKRIVQNKNMNQ